MSFIRRWAKNRENHARGYVPLRFELKSKSMAKPHVQDYFNAIIKLMDKTKAVSFKFELKLEEET